MTFLAIFGQIFSAAEYSVHHYHSFRGQNQQYTCVDSVLLWAVTEMRGLEVVRGGTGGAEFFLLLL